MAYRQNIQNKKYDSADWKKSIFYISTLVENLHCYYDKLVNQLINENINEKYVSIEISYLSTSIKYKSYKNKLQNIRGSNVIDENNYISFIFNY